MVERKVLEAQTSSGWADAALRRSAVVGEGFFPARQRSAFLRVAAPPSSETHLTVEGGGGRGGQGEGVLSWGRRHTDDNDQGCQSGEKPTSMEGRFVALRAPLTAAQVAGFTLADPPPFSGSSRPSPPPRGAVGAAVVAVDAGVENHSREEFSPLPVLELFPDDNDDEDDAKSHPQTRTSSSAALSSSSTSSSSASAFAWSLRAAAPAAAAPLSTSQATSSFFPPPAPTYSPLYVVGKLAVDKEFAVDDAAGEKAFRFTSPEALRAVHLLRAASDFVVCGVSTVKRDNCRLTPRLRDPATSSSRPSFPPPSKSAAAATTSPLEAGGGGGGGRRARGRRESLPQSRSRRGAADAMATERR